jgi:hypothetical protein
MTDIVELLQEVAAEGRHLCNNPSCVDRTCIAQRAADEIESLRGLLREARREIVFAAKTGKVPHDFVNLIDNTVGTLSDGVTDQPALCLARKAATDEPLTRCADYPRCPCGGPEGWPDQPLAAQCAYCNHPAVKGGCGWHNCPSATVKG